MSALLTSSPILTLFWCNVHFVWCYWCCRRLEAASALGCCMYVVVVKTCWYHATSQDASKFSCFKLSITRHIKTCRFGCPPCRRSPPWISWPASLECLTLWRPQISMRYKDVNTLKKMCVTTGTLQTVQTSLPSFKTWNLCLTCVSQEVRLSCCRQVITANAWHIIDLTLTQSNSVVIYTHTLVLAQLAPKKAINITRQCMHCQTYSW